MRLAVVRWALAAIAAAVSWVVLMWIFIWVGHAIYPNDIHNLIAQAGVLVVGPIGGITSGLLTYRVWLRSS